MKEQLFEKISEAVVEMEDEEVVDLCNESLRLKIPADETINQGLIKGMDRVGALYEEQEYFLPEVLICSDTLNEGIDILKPYVEVDKLDNPVKIVIGVIEGDTHDIGKNLVKIMMEAAGFQVYDLGRDVPVDEFINQAEKVGANFICVSTLMTTTMGNMRKLIEKLVDRGLRDKYRVMIGGGPISQKFADEIGADDYTVDANEAVRRVKMVSKELAIV